MAAVDFPAAYLASSGKLRADRRHHGDREGSEEGKLSPDPSVRGLQGVTPWQRCAERWAGGEKSYATTGRRSSELLVSCLSNRVSFMCLVVIHKMCVKVN